MLFAKIVEIVKRKRERLLKKKRKVDDFLFSFGTGSTLWPSSDKHKGGPAFRIRFPGRAIGLLALWELGTIIRLLARHWMPPRGQLKRAVLGWDGGLCHQGHQQFVLFVCLMTKYVVHKGKVDINISAHPEQFRPNTSWQLLGSYL